MHKNVTIAALLSLLATPALAQFPPPGVYACAESSGAPVGTLTLFVAGDYSLQSPDGISKGGQVASAGSDVNPLTGPLKDMELVGTFFTDETGETIFQFAGPQGLMVTCR